MPPITELQPAALLGEQFISTSSLTKSYGLSSLRCGWSLSSPAVAERIRRARDVIDGSGSVAAERLGTLAFAQLDRLEARTTALLGVNRPLVHDFLRGRPELEVVLPAQQHRGLSPHSWRRRHERVCRAPAGRPRATAIVPGRFFDAPAHFRLGFGGPSELAGGAGRLEPHWTSCGLECRFSGRLTAGRYDALHIKLRPPCPRNSRRLGSAASDRLVHRWIPC